MIAFDCGPGNAAINDWVMKHGGMHMDYNGKLAITGKVNEQIVASMMRHKFFAQYPPKAADRTIFNEKLEHLEGLSLEDGAATATAFIAEAVAYSLLLYLPEIPGKLIVCGGGAKNPTLVRFLRQRLPDIGISTAAEEGLTSMRWKRRLLPIWRCAGFIICRPHSLLRPALPNRWSAVRFPKRNNFLSRQF